MERRNYTNFSNDCNKLLTIQKRIHLKYGTSLIRAIVIPADFVRSFIPCNASYSSSNFSWQNVGHSASDKTMISTVFFGYKGFGEKPYYLELSWDRSTVSLGSCDSNNPIQTVKRNFFARFPKSEVLPKCQTAVTCVRPVRSWDSQQILSRAAHGRWSVARDTSRSPSLFRAQYLSSAKRLLPFIVFDFLFIILTENKMHLFSFLYIKVYNNKTQTFHDNLCCHLGHYLVMKVW